jgi:murein DD-endopeptidase MepM/ murein hydrolase activator NlpD
MGPVAAQSPPAELDGWPVVELTRAVSPAGATWVGTYGHGVLVQAAGDTAWRRIRSDTADSSLSWDFVQAIAFGPRGQVWVGTLGNGWGLSRDDGRTWRNWTYSELGPEWQYVAPGGILTFGDTTIVATADGLQVTTDDGAHWVAVVDGVGPPAKGPADTAIVALDSEYLVSLRQGGPGWVVAGSLPDGRLWQERNVAELAGARAPSTISISTAADAGYDWTGARREQLDSVTDEAARLRRPGDWQPRFGRPIGPHGNQHIDQTYRWGSTMGGNFQPHQGIEFNNPDGTAVLAIGPGRVVWSGPAERGALTVAVRHAPMTLPGGGSRHPYSVYYHNSSLDVAVGDSVEAGQQVARVGNTGRATNDHLHLEVHLSPVDDVGAIVDPAVRFPPHATNPELWIEPLPGTGLIAGRVFDAAGDPVPQARIYGIRKPEPRETPYAFAETYGPSNRSSERWGEHFAISDVPWGEQTLRVKIDGVWVERAVTVYPRTMTWVEFRPE